MRLLLVPALLAVTLLAASAHAQQDPAAAESLFRDAKAAEQRGDFKTACARFAESQRLDPAAGTLLNEADCEEHLGALAAAWGHFVEARDQLPKGDDRLPYTQQRVAALDRRVPHVIVRLPPGAPPGSRVLRGSIEIGPAALGVPLAVDPGPLALTLLVPGQPPATLNLVLDEGMTRDIVLELHTAPPVASPAAPAVASSPAPSASATRSTDAGTPSSTGDTKRTLGWVVGGVGVAGLALGTITGIMAMGDASTVKGDCNAGACQHQSGVDAASAGKTASLLSTVGFVGGAACTGVALYLLLTSGPSRPSATVGATPCSGAPPSSFLGGF